MQLLARKWYCAGRGWGMGRGACVLVQSEPPPPPTHVTTPQVTTMGGRSLPTSGAQGGWLRVRAPCPGPVSEALNGTVFRFFFRRRGKRPLSGCPLTRSRQKGSSSPGACAARTLGCFRDRHRALQRPPRDNIYEARPLGPMLVQTSARGVRGAETSPKTPIFFVVCVPQMAPP